MGNRGACRRHNGRQAHQSHDGDAAAAEEFTTRNGRPSRYVSSWYFGDGAALLNQQLAAFTTSRTGRITPLDPVLTGSAARPSVAASFGLRVGRHLNPRFTVELNVDYGPTRLELPESALADVEASRTTFASVWNEQFGPGMPFQNAVVSSSSEIEEGGGGQIVATGALTVKLRRGGPLVPFVTGGLGGVFDRGSDPSVTLRGNYSSLYILGEPFTINQGDTRHRSMGSTRPCTREPGGRWIYVRPHSTPRLSRRLATARQTERGRH